MIDACWPWQPSDLRMYSGLPSKRSVVLLTSSVAVPSDEISCIRRPCPKILLTQAISVPSFDQAQL